MSATKVDTFGAKVVEYRERLGMLQNELAKKVGLSKSHLNRIEKGTRKRPHVKKVLRMIEALRLTRGEAKELCELAELLPLVLENINFEEDGQGFALVKIEDGETEEEDKAGGGKEPGGERPTIQKPTQITAAPSTRLDSPLSISHQKILMRKLEVLERTIREIRALVGPAQDQE